MNENATYPQNFVNGHWDEDFRIEAHVTALHVFQEKFEALIDSLSTLEQFVLVDASKSTSSNAGDSEHEPALASKAHAIAQALATHYAALAEDGE